LVPPRKKKRKGRSGSRRGKKGKRGKEKRVSRLNQPFDEEVEGEGKKGREERKAKGGKKEVLGGKKVGEDKSFFGN